MYGCSGLTHLNHSVTRLTIMEEIKGAAIRASMIQWLQECAKYS